MCYKSGPLQGNQQGRHYCPSSPFHKEQNETLEEGNNLLTITELIRGSVGGGVVTKSCPALTSPRTVAHQSPLSMRFSRQECWNGLPFPPPGDLLDPRIEPMALPGKPQ